MERYLPFFKEQAKYRHENMSNIGWVNGMYVGRALGSCLPKGKKYPDEPMAIWKDEIPEEEPEQISDADRFAGFAEAFNRKFG